MDTMTAPTEERPMLVDSESTFVAPEPEPIGGGKAAGAREVHAPLVVIGTALCILAALLLSLVAELTVVGGLRHARDQQIDYASFRLALAEGVAPTGQTDVDGRVLTPGTPVALLRIPSLGVDEVVTEGTSSSILMGGPGHRRDTVLPGQSSTSVIMGRQAAYGGPFGSLDKLAVGDEIAVTTGQGEFTYKVTGLRRPGDPQPQPPAAGKGRLILTTADGTPYVAASTLRVDAELQGQPAERPARVFGSTALSPSERPMAGESAAWIPLVFWAQALALAAAGFVWAFSRWGRWQTWIVGVPLLVLLGLGVSGQITRLLPNLI